MTARDEFAKVLRDEIKRRTLPRVGWEPEQAWEPKQHAFGATEHDLADVLLASPAFADLIREAKREGWERRDKPWIHADKQVPIVPPELRDDSGTHEVECAGWNDCHCFGYLNPYDKEND